MAVSNVALHAPGDNFATPHARPEGAVYWTGGTGPFDTSHQWDTVNTFDSGNLITDVNTSVTSKDVGVPPSDMSAGTWYYRAQVTDTNDSDTQTSPTQTITIVDPDAQLRYLYVNYNVAAGFNPTADDDPKNNTRILYLNHNVTTGVPVPYIVAISPGAVDQGDTILITGFGFDNVARDWSSAARLYDNADPQAAGASFIALPEVSFAIQLGSDLNTMVVTVPSGAPSGWVVVINDDGT